MSTRPVTAPTTLEDACNACRVLADWFRERGEQRSANLLDLAGGRKKPTEGLSPEAVLALCGFDPRVVPGSGRRSGRTTRMLAEAVSAMSRGVRVDVYGRGGRFGTRQLREQLFGMASTALGREAALNWRRQLFHPDEELEFVDHSAMWEANQRRLRELPSGWAPVTAELVSPLGMAAEPIRRGDAIEIGPDGLVRAYRGDGDRAGTSAGDYRPGETVSTASPIDLRRDGQP